MSNTPHEIPEEFPEHAARIHDLKVANAHFARLLEDYHALNRQIHRAESNIEPTDDLHLTEMRKKRLALKDEILSMILKEARAEL